MTFEPGSPGAVEYHSDGHRWTPVFMRTLGHPPERVWDALTGREQVCAWAPYTASRDLGTVGPATLTMIGGDTAQELAANVVRADRPRLLEYAWARTCCGGSSPARGPGPGRRCATRWPTRTGCRRQGHARRLRRAPRCG
jgi:hypothetical protein